MGGVLACSLPIAGCSCGTDHLLYQGIFFSRVGIVEVVMGTLVAGRRIIGMGGGVCRWLVSSGRVA